MGPFDLDPFGFEMKRPLRDDDMSLMTTTEDEWASRLGLGYDDVLEYTYDVIVNMSVGRSGSMGSNNHPRGGTPPHWFTPLFFMDQHEAMCLPDRRRRYDRTWIPTEGFSPS